MQSKPEKPALTGWTIVAVSLTIVGACLFVIFWQHGWTDEGLSSAIRVTARSSFVWFIAAFSASPLVAFVPNALTRWQLANRRYLGISFALGHLIHGGTILAEAARTGGGSLAGRTHDVIGGGVIYGFIVFMLVTSFPRPAAWVGRRAWSALHTVGGYLVCLSFLSSYGGRVMVEHRWLFLPQAVAIVLVLSLRLARRFLIRRSPASVA